MHLDRIATECADKMTVTKLSRMLSLDQQQQQQKNVWVLICTRMSVVSLEQCNVHSVRWLCLPAGGLKENTHGVCVSLTCETILRRFLASLSLNLLHLSFTKLWCNPHNTSETDYFFVAHCSKCVKYNVVSCIANSFHNHISFEEEEIKNSFLASMELHLSMLMTLWGQRAHTERER